MASDKMQSKLCERISELEKEVEGLKKNLSRYSEKFAEQEETIDAQDDKINFYVSRMNEHILKNKELEEQIEKMKSITEGVIKIQSLSIEDNYNAGLFNGFVTVFNSIFEEKYHCCKWNENKNKWELVE